jgi:hypothetical protein
MSRKRKRSESSGSSGSSGSSASDDSGSESFVVDSVEEESGSSSSSSRSEVERIPIKRLKPKINENEKITTKAKPVEKSSKRVLKPKSSLVNQLLIRWWYALDPWPPVNYDYSYYIS